MSSTPATQAASAAGALPKVGETIDGKYRIDAVIAEGGMGVVYRATHLTLDDAVAIKCVRPIVGTAGKNPEVFARFLREAKASARVRSEHVARVFDVATLPSGAPYMVMELLEGRDLDQIVDNDGHLEVQDAVDYTLQACVALAEAHSLGIIHRDLKPANLFLTHRADGSPCIKVVDFGISKFSDADASGSDLGMTATHTTMGSPRYISPEQMRSARDVDARTDVWAVGIVLFELIDGQAPFDGETMTQVCASILQDPTPKLSARRQGVPPGLDAVIAKALEKKRDDRYASVAELARDLQPFASEIGQAAARRVLGVARRSDPNLGAFAAESMGLALASQADHPSSGEIRAARPAGPNSETSVTWAGLPSRQKNTRLLRAAAAAGLVVLVGTVGAVMALRGSNESEQTDSTRQGEGDKQAERRLATGATPPKAVEPSAKRESEPGTDTSHAQGSGGAGGSAKAAARPEGTTAPLANTSRAPLEPVPTASATAAPPATAAATTAPPATAAATTTAAPATPSPKSHTTKKKQRSLWDRRK